MAPHLTYGFTSGTVFGTKADLIMRPGLFKLDNPYIEYMAALNKKEKTVFLILLNNDDEKQTSLIEMDTKCLFSGKKIRVKNVASLNNQGHSTLVDGVENWNVTIDAYGLTVLKIKYK